ncbi:MAG: translation initiation factor IF-2 [Cyclobacteriaceae bacterium]|nr:translation initiation factor IF-2 [Cyclobacteriaceae bacterium]
MAEEKNMRLSQVARKLNVGRNTIIDFLEEKGFDVDENPNSKITGEQFQMLSREFASSASEKEEASSLTIGTKIQENRVIEKVPSQADGGDDEDDSILIKNLGSGAKKEEISAPAPKVEKEEPKEVKKEEEKEVVEKADDGRTKVQGLKVLGKIDLDKPKSKETKKEEEVEKKPVQKVEEKTAPKVEVKKEEPAVEIKEEIKVKEEPKEEPKVEVKAEPKLEAKEEAKEVIKEEPKEKAEVKAEEAAKVEPVAEKEAETPESVKPEATPEIAAEKTATPTKEEKKQEPVEEGSSSLIEAKADKLQGLKVVGKIVLPVEKEKKPVASSDERKDKKKRPRKRIPKSKRDTPGTGTPNRGTGTGTGAGTRTPSRAGNGLGARGSRNIQKAEPNDKEIQDKIKATLAKLSTSGKKSGAKYRREKRSAYAEAEEEKAMREQQDSKILKVTEFISVSDLSNLMGVSVNDVISTCLSLGMFVSINQRLDAEAITIISDEFGYNVEFISTEDEVEIETVDDPEKMIVRAPIVTIMGHVDHGKTSLLDYIRKTKVTAGEAGGITQHIGAYEVFTDNGNKIAFLDTPGHEAFTAMRARGAKVTDIVIIVVAADDDVMPQTKEAINHAQVAGVPIVIAINKIDKEGANPEKVKESLSAMNILVEDWGGKYQCQHISAKTGEGIDELLEKVLLEAELLELKAVADKPAQGSIIEASLDKGRGYVATVLVQSGTLKIGDIVVAGAHHGRVKAMFNHTGASVAQAGPSTPVLLLGLDGAPQAGDKFNVLESDREAREVASKRSQILREQSIRTKKHITLDEIGRRLAIGNFKELNVIVKGDVDGSVEALSDSLLKLSTPEVQVNIIHKGVGQISESDVLLASASDAVIVGFQVRPSGAAKKIAETEEIEIRLYSIIYDAINDVKDAMEGMLDPEVQEIITGNVEVREAFKISKVGTVAGCMVTDGSVKKKNPIRLIRDGIVVYSGEMGQLKRFKEDVAEVKAGYECGISIKNFNDIKEGDVIESYEQKEVKRKL